MNSSSITRQFAFSRAWSRSMATSPAALGGMRGFITVSVSHDGSEMRFGSGCGHQLAEVGRQVPRRPGRKDAVSTYRTSRRKPGSCAIGAGNSRATSISRVLTPGIAQFIGGRPRRVAARTPNQRNSTLSNCRRSPTAACSGSHSESCLRAGRPAPAPRSGSQPRLLFGRM